MSYNAGVTSVDDVVPALLAASGLSAAELARRSGVSRASVSEYVHGHRRPSTAQVERLAAAAGLRTDVRLRPEWEPRRALLEDVLALADALPLRPQPAATTSWRDLVRR